MTSYHCSLPEYINFIIQQFVSFSFLLTFLCSLPTWQTKFPLSLSICNIVTCLRFINSNWRFKTWRSANYLCINENKATGLYFSLDRKSSDFHKNITFLGIVIESGLGWNAHIKLISKKIAKGVFVLRCSKRTVICLLSACACVLWGNLSRSGPGFDPRSGQVSWVRFFRGFSSPVRRMSGSFRPGIFNLLSWRANLHLSYNPAGRSHCRLQNHHGYIKHHHRGMGGSQGDVGEATKGL